MRFKALLGVGVVLLLVMWIYERPGCILGLAAGSMCVIDTVLLTALATVGAFAFQILVSRRGG